MSLIEELARYAHVYEVQRLEAIDDGVREELFLEIQRFFLKRNHATGGRVSDLRFEIYVNLHDIPTLAFLYDKDQGKWLLSSLCDSENHLVFKRIKRLLKKHGGYSLLKIADRAF
ncbi:MAG: hypothetical protein KDD70_10440 [Bdellovibrionales bacterium]|nr:hypothetical protein [Bdellovibrionales bacterium]